MAVDSPWYHRHKALYRWVATLCIDVSLRRGWETIAPWLISYNTSLIDIRLEFVAAVCCYGTDPVVAVGLNGGGWVRFDDDRVSLA